MTPASIIADAAIGFLIGAAVGAPVIALQAPAGDWSFLSDLAGAGGVGAVITVLWLTQKDRKEEREKLAEERKQQLEAITKERERAADERKHGMEQVAEITATFSKTVLDLMSKKP